MADLIDRQAAKEAFEWADADVCEEYDDCTGCDWGFGLTTVKDVLNKLPTVDAVEVVRCKDCKHRADEWECGNYLCNLKMIGFVRANDFCSYGERREA